MAAAAAAPKALLEPRPPGPCRVVPPATPLSLRCGAGGAGCGGGAGGRRDREGGSGPFSDRLRSLEPLLPCWASPNLSLIWQIQFAIEKCAFCASAVARIFPSAWWSPLPGSPGGFLSGWAGSARAASRRPAGVRLLQEARPRGLHRRCLVSASHGAHLPWTGVVRAKSGPMGSLPVCIRGACLG